MKKTVCTIFLYTLLAVKLHTVTGCLQLNGQDFSLPASSPEVTVREGFSSRQLYLVPSLRFSCSAVVNQWLVYFESNGDCFVQFQVWRQDSTENCTSGRFNLVGQNNFSLTASKSLHNITPPAEDMIQVQPGDIVGFLTEFSNNRNRRSVQTNPNAGGVTFVVDGVRPQNNLGTVIMSTQDTCSLGTDNGVPLLTTMVTPVSVTTDSLVTTPATPMVSTIPPETTTTPSIATPQPVTMVTSQSEAPPSTSKAPVHTHSTNPGVTTDGTTPGGDTTDDSGTDGLNQGSTPPPSEQESISLTTLILSVVIAVGVSVVCVVAMVILFRYTWRKMRRKKRTNQLAAVNKATNSLHNPTYDEEKFSAASKEKEMESGLYESMRADANPYEEPVRTMNRPHPPSAYSQPAKMRGRPLPQIQSQENTYDIPLETLLSAPLGDSAYATPRATESEYTFMRPTSIPVVTSEEEDYSNMDGVAEGAESAAPGGLTESSIYETVPQ